jgi:hypothetical protein
VAGSGGVVVCCSALSLHLGPEDDGKDGRVGKAKSEEE